MDSPRPCLVYKGWEGRRLDHPIANLQSTLLVLREFALASLVIAPSRNNIEKEVLLLLTDEYRPTCPFSMTNPGSLSMGFAEADPHQLASSVGTPQDGITISAASSPTPVKTSTPSASIDSSTRTDSDLFGSLGFMAHLSSFRPEFADLRSGIKLTFGAYQIYINHWGILRLTASTR